MKKAPSPGLSRASTGFLKLRTAGPFFWTKLATCRLQLQAKILRVIQEGEIRPVGSAQSKKVDVRIISATNRDLRNEIARENFREDLFYRLNVLPLHVPALRERPEDIALLLDHFLGRDALRLGAARKTFSRTALEFLLTYEWPGNIRELENFVKHILVITPGDLITREDLSNHFVSITPAAHSPAAGDGTHKAR